MTKSKTDNRGGARPGAGRPCYGDQPRVTKSWTIDPSHAWWVGNQADMLGISESEFINGMLSDLHNADVRARIAAKERDALDPSTPSTSP